MKGGGRSRSYTRYTGPLSGTSEGSIGTTNDNCSQIHLKTKLSGCSPLFATLNKKDSLEVVLSKKILSVVDQHGNHCGNIVSSINDRIINCIARGYNFQASVTGEPCEILITIKK